MTDAKHPVRPAPHELEAQQAARIDELHEALRSEAGPAPKAAPISAEELHERLAARHPKKDVVIHPTSVEPHPDLTPPLCVERERQRMSQQKDAETRALAAPPIQKKQKEK